MERLIRRLNSGTPIKRCVKWVNKKIIIISRCQHCCCYCISRNCGFCCCNNILVQAVGEYGGYAVGCIFMTVVATQRNCKTAIIVINNTTTTTKYMKVVVACRLRSSRTPSDAKVVKLIRMSRRRTSDGGCSYCCCCCLSVYKSWWKWNN